MSADNKIIEIDIEYVKGIEQKLSILTDSVSQLLESNKQLLHFIFSPKNDAKEYYKIKDIEQVTGYSRTAVVKLIEEGKIEAIKLPTGTYKIPHTEYIKCQELKIGLRPDPIGVVFGKKTRKRKAA